MAQASPPKLEKKAGGGLFSSKSSAAPPPPSDSAEDLAVLARRLRLLEERYSRVENNLRNIEDHLNDLTRDFTRRVVQIKSVVEESNSRIDEMQDRMLVFLKEIDLLAKAEDVDVMRKYIQYWDPVKFVQVKQVEKIVKDVLSDMGLIERH